MIGGVNSLPDYKGRMQQCIHDLSSRNLLPYVVFSLTNIRYLTGFCGSNALLVLDSDGAVFITDSRYEEYARALLGDLAEFRLSAGGNLGALQQCFEDRQHKSVFLEEHGIPWSMYLQLQKKIPGVTFEAGGDAVNLLRMVKQQDEIALIRKAVRLTDDCFSYLVDYVRPGLTEWEVSVAIENYYRTHGSSGTSFTSIVATGAHSSMPHYETSMDAVIKKGDVLLIDMGCVWQGYNSDLTRTIFVGSVPEDMAALYAVVRKAQESAISAARAGIQSNDLDAVARNVISSHGYGEYFGHSLGHGVGLEVHELPSLSPSGDPVTLSAGAVVTIEPGIYIPGRGGVRIEDMILVLEDGCEILTGASKEIICAGETW